MKTIKKLREARQLSTKELGKMLNATEHDVEDWEKGVSIPPAAKLKDLAMIFGMSVEDIIGEHPLNYPDKIETNLYYMFSDKDTEDGWWGHVGLLLNGYERTKWFPITMGNANKVYGIVNDSELDNEWLLINTLNNRLLAVKPTELCRLWLLDDAQDQPGDDWEIPIDGYSGKPSEFYKGLEDYIFDGDTSDYSEEFLRFIEQFTDEKDMGDEELYSFVMHTHIYSLDGMLSSYFVEPSNLWNLVQNIENSDCPEIINLSNESFDTYFPSKQISVIDMPFRQVMEGARYWAQELEY